MKFTRHILAFIMMMAAGILPLPALCMSPDSTFVSDVIDTEIVTDVGFVPLPDSINQRIPYSKKIGDLNPNNDWLRQMLRGKLNMTDTTVHYPRFVKFCVDVYNWGDRVFNSYDTTYVVGTGRRWKARLLSDNWVDSYYVKLEDLHMRMMSDIYCNLGAYVQYMAVSVGYSLDFSNIIGNKPTNHKKLEFGFNCARFNAEIHYWENTGGTYFRTFGDYRDGHLFKEYFPGISLKYFNVNAYYFFNNRRYSQGAAYNFSKFQKKDAGSFLIGLNFSDLDMNMNFALLPDNLRPYYNLSEYHYHLHYKNYSLVTGYGYNHVFNPHLLYNFTVMPIVGITSCYRDSFEGRKTLLALSFKGRMSLTYNLKDFFSCLVLKIDGTWFHSRSTSIFSSIENASLSVGVRF